MLGRGTRIAPGEIDCVRPDFGGSVMRLGCLEDMDWRGADLSSRDTIERTWCCPACEVHNSPKLRARAQKLTLLRWRRPRLLAPRARAVD
jgi:hypothetical protein